MVIHGYSDESNEIILEWTQNDESADYWRYFDKGVIDKTTGLILVGWQSYRTLDAAKAGKIDISKFILLVPDDTASAKASTWGGKGLARAITATFGSNSYNIFANGDKIYFGVTFKASETATDTILAENCYKQEELYVYDSENNLISKSIKISGSLMPLDGRKSAKRN